MRLNLSLLAPVGALIALSAPAHADQLDTVKAAGVLKCGVGAQ